MAGTLRLLTRRTRTRPRTRKSASACLRPLRRSGPKRVGWRSTMRGVEFCNLKNPILRLYSRVVVCEIRKIEVLHRLHVIKGLRFGIFALALLVFFMLIVRVIKHQHCCDTEGKERTFKQKARGSAEEMSNFGVLPTLVLATCLWVPIALQQTIVAPCWECYDFEAAAVHEVRDPFAPSAPPSPPTPSPPTPTPTLSRPTPPPPTLTHVACEVPCVLMTDWPRPRAEPPGRDPSLGERSRDGNLPSRLLSHRLQRLQHLHRVERWHEALRFEGFPLGPLHEPLGARGRRRVGGGE